MLRLDIEEWQDAEGVKCPEHKATWARLKISVNKQVVSEVYDRDARSVRSGIYLPLYPLAEWIASRWFALLYESEVPGKGDEGDFWRRHVLRSASEGFALPELEIVSEGPEVRLEWRPLDLPDHGLRFLSAGKARIDRDALVDGLGQFVNTVVSRLEDEIPGQKTFLQDEWESVHSLDPEEIEFCEKVASLGLDPFSLEEAQQRDIVLADEQIPPALRDDFFSAAAPGALPGHLQWIHDAMDQAHSISGAADTLPSLREFVRASSPRASGMTPWDAGYACARKLRGYLHLDGGALRNEEFEETLGFASAHDLSNDQVNFDALAVCDAQTQLGGFVLSGRLKASKRFAYARALFEYLVSPAAESLVSRALTHRQSANRAFAAELLAPAEAIRNRLSHDSVSQEQIEELADEFGVSTYVIEHQIVNHKLGQVQAMTV